MSERVDSTTTRRELRSFVARHRALLGTAAALAVGLAIFVLVWFQPQKAFISKRVDEGAPAPAALQAPAAPAPTLVAQGGFRSLDHETTGRALVQRFASGSLVLRLEGFRTTNGPDLRVYLSPGSLTGKTSATSVA